MTLLAITSLLFLASFSGLGVFCPHYNDNLLQRIGMSMTSIGALSMVWWIITHPDIPNAFLPLILGIDAYVIGVALKVILFKHKATHDMGGN